MYLNKYYKIWLPITSILLFFVVIELICRTLDFTDPSTMGFKFYVRHVDNDVHYPFMIEDPLFMWSPKPNYEGNVKSGGFIKINSEGFRDKEYKIKKDKNSFRILSLGDSSTFGWGVNSFSKLYHTLLEEKLNKDFNPNINYEVINGGVTGYTSHQGLNIYKKKFVKYKPDVVTFYFGINEKKSAFYLNDRQIMQPKTSDNVIALKSYFMEKSAFYRLLSIIALNINAKFRKRVQRVSLEDFGRDIVEMNELCKKNGAMLLLISPLLNNDHWPSYNFPIKAKRFVYNYREKLEDIAKQHNIPLLTIDQLTEKSSIPNKKFFADSVHPNEQGNIILMEFLLDSLKEHTNLGMSN
jgi:lysophospholipase L1-like esterase|tara:strand:+ start:148 stop:1206 length:1059 start_codon:yes stop_codon:yes gene_type:complete